MTSDTTLGSVRCVSDGTAVTIGGATVVRADIAADIAADTHRHTHRHTHRPTLPAIVALADPTAVASMSPARVAELRACAGRTTALMGTVH
jgi:hypothetical protein